MKLLIPFLAALLAISHTAAADPLGTAFTYQGRLNHTGAPANGSFDLKFELYDAAVDGNLIGAAIELPAQNIAGGLFSADLDFGGPLTFDGTAYWVQMSAKTEGAADYLPVPDRTPLRAAPYAIHALSAASVKDGAVTTGSLADGAVTGAKLSAGAVGFAQLSAPAAPALGQMLTFDGADLSWTDPPGGGAGSGGPWLVSTPKIYYNGGNVGIGTSNPLAPLQVVANWNSGETPNIRLSGSKPTMMWVRDRLFPEPSSTDYWLAHMGNTVQGNLSFYHRSFNGSVFPPLDTGYRPVMSVTPSLNVGIGTESPASKLHIEGANAITVSGVGPYINWLDHGSGRSAAISSAGGVLYWRVPNANNSTIVTAGGVDYQGIYCNGRVFAQDDVTATRLILRADPNAPVNAAVLCGDANVSNFVPYNTATNLPLNMVVRDATVRKLTITGGADLAEPFAMSGGGVEPGTVVVIDEKNPGKLKTSTQSYDKKVAGIVSGANGIEPGISLIQEDKLEAGENVALSGRVYVKADAASGAIEPGDLLTTSPMAGHAMKAANDDQARGAILGKAMTPLTGGTGMVLVLVTLQ